MKKRKKKKITEQLTIDEVNVKTEKLYVYGRDLTKLISTFSFYGAVYHVLEGQYPNIKDEKKINRFLIAAVQSFFKEQSHVIELSNLLEFFTCDYESAVITGILYCEKIAKEKAKDLVANADLNLTHAAEGLYLLSLIPIFICYVLNNDTGIKQSILTKERYIQEAVYGLKNNRADYIQFIFKLFTKGKRPTANQIKLFHAVLVSLHAGFGIVTPTIILARFSASTMASIAKNYVASITGSGPSHVGACNSAMKLLIESFKNQNDEKAISLYCQNKPFPGFGHPLLIKDPRNKILLKIFTQQYPKSRLLNVYKKLTKTVKKLYCLNPNIDLISAIIFLEMGFPEKIGTSLFLFSRMSSVLAHSIQKKQQPSFGLKRSDARKKIAKLPKKWI